MARNRKNSMVKVGIYLEDPGCPVYKELNEN